MTHHMESSVWACWFLAAVTASGGEVPSTAAHIPQPGEVQRLPVVTIVIQAGSTDKETKQVTYSPPPGWYVRSHKVHCIRKHGNTSYAVSTVPQDWDWSLEAKVADSYKFLIDLAGQSGHDSLKTKFALEQEQMLSELRRVRATHHALVVDATAKGEGFLRSGAVLELTVTAEMVFVGTDESLEKTIARHRAELGKTVAKPESGSATTPAKQKQPASRQELRHK